MMKFTGRVVETPMGSTIDSLQSGGYWVCDRDRNCREVTGLWEAEEYLRERESGRRLSFPGFLILDPSGGVPGSV